MAQQAIRESFNDGYMEYGTRKTERSAKRIRVDGKFEAMGRLAYQEMSCREQDYQLAKAFSAVLDMKIKTLFPPNLKNFSKNKLKVMLGGTEYDVIKVDNDRAKRYLYFYLQEVGNFEQNESENGSAN